VYRSWEAINQSTLKELDRSPLHARYALLHPSAPTPAMNLGSAAHTAILEPEHLERTYAQFPAGVNRRTNEGKRIWAELEASGREVLRSEEYGYVCSMRDAVWANPVANALLAGDGRNEFSVVWDEHLEEGPLRSKARLDRVTSLDGWPTIVDLKSARDASAREFRWAIGEYRYYLQAAMYRRALNALAHVERRYIILVVENKPPHGVALYELDAASLAEGDRQLEARLELWHRCERKNDWPGYPVDVQSITLPERYWRDDD
jgi:hypothetical protein